MKDIVKRLSMPKNSEHKWINNINKLYYNFLK